MRADPAIAVQRYAAHATCNRGNVIVRAILKAITSWLSGRRRPCHVLRAPCYVLRAGSSRATCYGLRATGGLVTCYVLRATCYGRACHVLRATGYGLRIRRPCHVLRATGRLARVRSGVLLPGWCHRIAAILRAADRGMRIIRSQTPRGALKHAPRRTWHVAPST